MITLKLLEELSNKFNRWILNNLGEILMGLGVLIWIVTTMLLIFI